MVDGRPREPVRRQIDRRRGEAIERQPSGFGEREVAGRCRRRSDRRRPGVAPRTGSGQRRRDRGARHRSRATLRGATLRRGGRWPRGRRRGRTSTAAAPSRRAPPSPRRRRRCRRPATLLPRLGRRAARRRTPRHGHRARCTAQPSPRRRSHCARVATDALERALAGERSWAACVAGGRQWRNEREVGVDAQPRVARGLAPQHHGGPAGAGEGGAVVRGPDRIPGHDGNGLAAVRARRSRRARRRGR